MKFVTCLILFYLSSIVWLAGIEASYFMTTSDMGQNVCFIDKTIQMDAQNYKMIVDQGYSYSDTKRSLVAFFPLFPLLCSIVRYITGFSSEISLIVVANLFYVLSLMVLVARDSKIANNWHLVLLCIFPSCFYFRFGYAESTLLFFLSIFLTGISRNWSIWVLSIIAGAASATRPVGIAPAIVVLWIAKRAFSRDMQVIRYGKSIYLLKIILILILSCWGLIGYMLYLWYAFDNPFAYITTQVHWKYLAPENYTFLEKALSLLTLEPIWNVYNPNSARYWINGDTHDSLLFSCSFWNPILYMFSWVLIGIGVFNKWLKDYEILLSVLLLLIPYVTRGFEMSMASHARFAAIAVPQYYVLGRLFASIPYTIVSSICGILCLLMGFWTAMFCAGFAFF